ncbi:MAG TPA: hypothetical protein VFV01_47955 [Spirillospora sp.]|nr:hypothetical protein [Spirillospora sp.]
MAADQVRTWLHSRKGRITGTVVADDGEWVTIRLAGWHDLAMASRTIDGSAADGEQITVRKALLTEVAAD